MKKKYVLLISSLILVIAMVGIVDAIKANYKLGQELNSVTIRLENQCIQYAESYM